MIPDPFIFTIFIPEPSKLNPYEKVDTVFGFPFHHRNYLFAERK